jgi:hypothetical protein
MSPVNLVFDHSLRDRPLQAQHHAEHAPGERLPYRLAVPLIIAMSAGLWVGVWKLGSLLVGLVG